MKQEYELLKLDNGISVLNHYNPSAIITHIGFMINAGSRDELENEHGMAHFIEHCIFKGTKKRNALDIINCLDNVGGELNAYTTKEETCFYASILNEHLERALELLSDITFHSIFPKNELNKEKRVIIEEINSYLDSPSEQIIDDFEDIVFSGHELGRNILGTVKSLHSFNAKKLIQFTKRNYVNKNIILLCSGNHKINKIIKLAQKYISKIPNSSNGINHTVFESYVPQKKHLLKNTHQLHYVAGRTAYDIKNPKRYAFALLNNILGGPAMNSKLNLSLRERHALTYDVSSSFTPMKGTGIWWVYFSCEEKSFEKAKKIFYQELKKTCTKKISTDELKIAKEQMIGHIALTLENNQNALFGVGKTVLMQNRIIPIEETIKKINEVTSDQIKTVANEMLEIKKLSELIYYPKRKK